VVVPRRNKLGETFGATRPPVSNLPMGWGRPCGLSLPGLESACPARPPPYWRRPLAFVLARPPLAGDDLVVVVGGWSPCPRPGMAVT
jgi:hypothetical protein